MDSKEEKELEGQYTHEFEQEKKKEKSKDDLYYKEMIYDKLPINYKQADILVKVLFGILAIIIIYFIVTSGRMPWN